MDYIPGIPTTEPIALQDRRIRLTEERNFIYWFVAKVDSNSRAAARVPDDTTKKVVNFTAGFELVWCSLHYVLAEAFPSDAEEHWIVRKALEAANIPISAVPEQVFVRDGVKQGVSAVPSQANREVKEEEG